MQGCVASPLLFTLFISDIVNILKKSGLEGIAMNGLYELHLLLFAVDMVLLASFPKSLQLKIYLLDCYFQNLGLKINIDKTKVVIFRSRKSKGGEGHHPTFGSSWEGSP